MSYKWNKTYRRTERGCLTQLYHNIIQVSKRSPWKTPNFTKEEFMEWGLKNSDYIEVFNIWKSLGFRPGFKPSIDRIDNFKPYEFSNMRVICWGENHKKMIKNIKDGVWKK